MSIGLREIVEKTGKDAVQDARERLKRHRSAISGRRKKSRLPSVEEKLARLLTGQEDDIAGQAPGMERTPPVPTSPGNDPSSPESKTDDANESEGIDVRRTGRSSPLTDQKSPSRMTRAVTRAELRNLETGATTAKVRRRAGMLR